VTAPALPVEEKAERVFGALMPDDGTRPRLTIPQLQVLTGMSRVQVRQGWKWLRETLGVSIAVMEPHREYSVYFLSDEFDDGVAYLFWQTSNVYRRVVSARNTLRDLKRASEHLPEVANALEESEGNLSGVRSNLRQLLRELHERAGVSEDKLNAILTS
jgi:hypothetical protein